MTNSLSQALKQALEKKGFQASPPDKAPPLGRNKQPQSPSKPAPAEEPMTAKFHNPYHFVPVNHEEARRGQWLAKKDFLTPPKDTDYWSHARYATATGSYHGRILCKLTTITPIFIGAGRSKGTEDAPGVVQPFTLRESPGLHKKPPDCQDLPAIPASSLRGLISSVAEAASNSALRVLAREFPSKGKKIDKEKDVFDFFAPLKGGKAEHDREMLPMHPKRTMISPAEMVFGFVETQEQGTANADQALAYAGRVRFSHALFEPKNDQERCTPFLPEVTLKILDKPKPPCPAMYFTQKDSRVKASYIPNQKLDSQGHKPQGRKFYLHHREEEVQKSCWKTHYDEAFFKESTTLSKKDLSEEKLKKGRFKQKVVITPIPAGRTFCFHVDFDNLTTYELGMLLYALQPNASFQHKIGMGKPLGLGSVSIEAVAVESIDRKGRYLISDIFNEPRYAESWRQHQEEHPGEASTPTEGSTPKLSVGEVKKEFEETMLPEIKYALETIGNPACVRQRVHTPLRSSQRGGEEEVSTYQWFSKNDDKNNNSKQCLAPITPENSSKEAGVVQGILPTLRRN
ncbi:MAG: TIGR03986 family CRISPR-associated RAMP protein [Desulfobulbus sp.]|jgi:CRISPR/Cas system CSM-associated protein Csm3 (group 7 of RAMP superfamily)|nr:TIGR03986 family CRISPR-associated RAMP protein [Desulfobulbus sp.]